MGSSNLQCAISKETIESGDKTVTFILEPVLESGKIKKILKPASTQGEYFKLNSLPILGVYDDYGRSFAAKNQEDTISLVKEFYSFDYSEELGDDWGSRGWRLNRGGPVDSPYETNTYELVVLKEAYDTLIENTNNTLIKTLLNDGKISKAFNEAIDPQLLSAAKKRSHHDSVIAAATFLKGMRDLGLSITPAPTICAQMAINDFELSLEVHNKLNEKKALPSSCCFLPKHFCMLTKKAIPNNKTIYLLPLMSNMEYNQPIDLISFDDHKVNARFSALSAPLKCLYKEGKLSLVDNVNDSLDDVRDELSLPASMSDDDVLEAITEHRPVTKKDGYFSFSSLVSYVVFSEKAFSVLTAEETKSYKNIKLDADFFSTSLIKLHSISEMNHDNFDSFKNEIEKSGCFNDRGLKYVSSIIEIYGSEIECTQSSKEMIIRRIIERVPPCPMPNEKYPRLYNSFYEMFFNFESGKCLLHDKQAVKNQEKISDIFDKKYSKEDFSETLKSVVSCILENNLVVLNILNGLNKAALPLMPSDDYVGELRVYEQNILMEKISKISYERLALKIEEDDSEDY